MQSTISPDQIASLCARCDSASASVSDGLAQLASQTGPRGRAKWRHEMTLRKGVLSRAIYPLTLALIDSPEMPAAMRQHAETVHGHACRQLALLCDETPSF